MGRDDAKAVRGLAGGRAPARAFAQFMARAVGGTPPEPLVTETAEEGLGPEPDAQSYGITMDEPTPMDGEAPPGDEPPRLDDNWLDKTLKEPAQPQAEPR
jgi:penicillin-binding protein 1A